jgi:hypothetical protein
MGSQGKAGLTCPLLSGIQRRLVFFAAIAALREMTFVARSIIALPGFSPSVLSPVPVVSNATALRE